MTFAESPENERRWVVQRLEEDPIVSYRILVSGTNDAVVESIGPHIAHKIVAEHNALIEARERIRRYEEALRTIARLTEVEIDGSFDGRYIAGKRQGYGFAAGIARAALEPPAGQGEA